MGRHKIENKKKKKKKKKKSKLLVTEPTRVHETIEYFIFMYDYIENI